MYRTEKLVVRLNRDEVAMISRLADSERLPASTLARRLLLLEAEKMLRPLSSSPKVRASEGVRP